MDPGRTKHATSERVVHAKEMCDVLHGGENTLKAEAHGGSGEGQG